MKRISRIFAVLALFAVTAPVWGQTCQTREEVPDPVKTAVETAAQQVFDQASRGDTNGIRANSIASLQSNFNGIAAAVNDNKPAFQQRVRSFALLSCSIPAQHPVLMDASIAGFLAQQEWPPMARNLRFPASR